MGVFLVTNITDTSSDPKTIYIDDIPNRASVAIAPGRTIDLERLSTRNQINESLQIRVHFNEGRITVDTLGTSPRERFFVDTEISSLDLGTSAALPLQQDRTDGAAYVSGGQGGLALTVRHDADGYLAPDGYYAPLQTDELGRLKVRTGFEERFLTEDGYLKTAISGLELGDLEINVEAEINEGTTRVPGHVGSFALAVRNDAKTALTADQTYTPFQVDGYGNLRTASTQEGDWTVTSLQGTDPWIVQVTNLPTTVDTNYGTSGSSTIRTAAQIGNSSGQADFNAGTTTGQTLRVVLPTDQSPIPAYQSGSWDVNSYQAGVWSVRTQDGYGVEISSTDSSLDVNITTATLAVTQSGTWTVDQGTNPWIVQTTNLPLVVDTDYGASSASTIRTAAQVGNATGAADFNAGTTTSQTLRVVLPTDQSPIPAYQSGSWDVNSYQAGTWSVRTQDGYGVEISSTGSSLDVNITTATLAVTQSGTWTVDQGTSPWVVQSTNLPTTVDTSYGTVGASTIRAAAQIGNAAGPAEFNAGTTTAQTLRVVLPTDQSPIPATQSGTWDVNAAQDGVWSTRTQDGYGVEISSTGSSLDVNVTNVVTVDQGTTPWTVEATNLPTTVDTNYGVTGASTLRAAAQIGNSGGQADFNAGTTTSQTLRVVLPTDQSPIPSYQSGAWTVGLDPSLLDADGYLRVVNSLEIGELEVHIEAEKAEDSQHVSGDVGSFVLAVRNDSESSLVNANLDYAPFQVDSLGHLKVAAKQFGTWTVDQGTNPWVIDFDAQRLDTDGYLKVSIADVEFGDLEINVEAEVAEGSARIPSHMGSFALAVRNDAKTALTADQTYSPFQTDSIGNLRVAATQEGAWVVDQGTSPWVVQSTNLPTTVDTNYGTVGPDTIRTAAQIGNATGAADFNAGTTTAQTLRVVLPTDQSPIPATQSGTWTVDQGTNPWVIDFAANRLDNDGYLRVAIAEVEFGDLEVNIESEYQEDSQHVSGDVGSFVLSVRKDTDGPLSDLDGDYSPFQTDNIGRLKVRTGFEDALFSPDGYLSVSSAQYGSWDIRDITGTISLPTGAATFDEQQNHSAFLTNIQNSLDDIEAVVEVLNHGDPSTAQRVAAELGVGGAAVSGSNPVPVSTRDGYGVEISSTDGALNTYSTNDKDYGTVGSDTIRTASQVGNATGAADFNAGTTTAQTLRVVLPTDQSPIPATQSGTWTVDQGTNPWVIDFDPSRLDGDGYLKVSLSEIEVNLNDLNVNIEAEYNENTFHTPGSIGNYSLTLRRDADTAVASTDGYYAPFQTDNIGRLKVRTGFEDAFISPDGYLEVSSAQYGVWNINDVSGTISLPTGASTLAEQQSQTALLTTIDASLNDIEAVVEVLNHGDPSVAQRVAAELGIGGAAVSGSNPVPVSTRDGYGLQISSTDGSFNIYSTNDRDYGVVSADTIRTAAQIGNSSGQADFNAGTTTGQTLRVVLPTDQSPIPATQSGVWSTRTQDGSGTPITSTNGALDVNITKDLDTDFGTVGSETLRTAAQLGDGYGNPITSQATSDNARRGADVWTIKGVPQHFNGTNLGTTPVDITPSSTTTAILITNSITNASSDLVQVSFDGGTNYFDIVRGQTLSLECEVSTFKIKSNTTGTDYQILVTRR